MKRISIRNNESIQVTKPRLFDVIINVLWHSMENVIWNSSSKKEKTILILHP